MFLLNVEKIRISFGSPCHINSRLHNFCPAQASEATVGEEKARQEAGHRHGGVFIALDGNRGQEVDDARRVQLVVVHQHHAPAPYAHAVKDNKKDNIMSYLKDNKSSSGLYSSDQPFVSSSSTTTNESLVRTVQSRICLIILQILSRENIQQ